MCSVPKIDTSAVVAAQRKQQEQLKEQLNKNNVLLSNSEVARTTGEKTGNKRTVSSLRVPMRNQTNTGATGVNTADTTTGLNIPV